MGSSDEKRRLISQGLYVDNVKIVIKDVASTKGFFIKMYRQKEDWSRGRKEVQTIEFRRPGFSKSTAINIVAKNPYYDPVAAKAAKDSMKR